MEIGTGIFCGATFLGFVYLFIKTRETWNWKKITLWSLGTPIVLTVLVVGYFYISDAWQNRLQVVTSLNGIALGEKLSDVLFKYEGFEKGRLVKLPDGTGVVLSGEETPEQMTLFKTKLNAKYNIQLQPFREKGEHYFNSNLRVHIDVENKIVTSIEYSCSDEASSDYSQVNGIRCDDGGEEVQKKYGKSLRVLCSKDDNFLRAYDAVDYGVRYILQNNKVHGFLVADKEYFSSDEQWVSCE